MKRLFVSVVLFVGVGFAMMGNPAQAGDDNCGNDKIGTAVHAVTNTPMAPVHHGRDYIKHEWKVKKDVDFTKMKMAITLGPWFESCRRGTTLKTISSSMLKGQMCVILKPVKPKKPGESCSPIHRRDVSKHVPYNNNKQFDVSELNANLQEVPTGDDISICKPKPITPPGKGCGFIGDILVVKNHIFDDEQFSLSGFGKESLLKSNPKPDQSTE